MESNSLFKVSHSLLKVPYRPFQSTTQPSSKYHTTYSKYNTTLYKYLDGINICMESNPSCFTCKTRIIKINECTCVILNLAIFIKNVTIPARGLEFKLLLDFYMKLYDDIRTPFSMYHITIFKIPHHPLQSTIPHSPLQNITPPYSKYHTTIFKVPHHALRSTTSPLQKYHQ